MIVGEGGLEWEGEGKGFYLFKRRVFRQLQLAKQNKLSLVRKEYFSVSVASSVTVIRLLETIKASLIFRVHEYRIYCFHARVLRKKQLHTRSLRFSWSSGLGYGAGHTFGGKGKRIPPIIQLDYYLPA